MNSVQVIQARYRARLADFWQVAPGSRVLEIGCGQGDMTAVLAGAVGPDGHVLAVDSAEPDYGSPSTLGEATRLLKESELGGRLDFRFQFDLFEQVFPDDAFDYVVLAHSSWYFESSDQLLRTLVEAGRIGKVLLFAEWDLEIRSFDQLAHLLAVLIQGQAAVFAPNPLSNVRTPLSRGYVYRLLDEAGWAVVREVDVDTSELQDGDWEVRACLSSSFVDGLADRARALLESQRDVLRGLAAAQGNLPLGAFAVVAERFRTLTP